MATLVEPKLLLLDEHTAALDPKTAQTVLNLTNDIVTGHNITTIMITHNMRDAIKYGNRLLMLNNGRIIFDVAGEEKKKLTFEQLLSKFEVDENIEISDTMLLSH
jgi:putative ABC transport system ATP-binding protein